MKRDCEELIISIMLMFFSGFPLIEILSKSLVIDQVSNFSLIVIVIWLVIILISSIIYFVTYWMEKFDQLHFKGAVYTVPKIYQVKGLHSSSSLHKITIAQRGISRFGDRCQNAGRWRVKSKEDLAYKLSTQSGLVAQLVRATDS